MNTLNLKISPVILKIKNRIIENIQLSSKNFMVNISKLNMKCSPCNRGMKMNNIEAIVVCGPSGSGKTTLLEMMISCFNSYLKFSVSHTTRLPRRNEINGKSYYFVEKSTFQQMITNKEFVEYSYFSGNYYGTSFKELSANSKSGFLSLLDVDLRGVINLQKTNLKAKYIFIKPPTIEFLERNLRKRGTESDESIQTRIRTAIEDMKLAEDVKFDLILENRDLEISFENLKEFLEKEVIQFKENCD